VNGQPIAAVKAGLVSSVGLSAAASCAAIRAAVTNHTPTRFINEAGEWILAGQVPLDPPWRGRKKLVTMLRMAVEECIDGVEQFNAASVPVMLCLAESSRHGRLEGLDENVLGELQRDLSLKFHATLSGVIASGRVSVVRALSQARTLLHQHRVPYVLIAAADSLLVGPTLARYESEGRLLTPLNSDGFIPGEAGGALLIAREPGRLPSLVCEGLGFATERAVLGSDEPFRAEGMKEAMKRALLEANCGLHDVDFRVTDNSGEQYYFKEAALAVSRTLRRRKEEFDIWHPADCLGEVGAAIGAASVAVALTACVKGYSPGARILIHAGNDAGDRGVSVWRYEGTA
jgi:3-oxoacyl-[acyl-carrier-protein] synthase-1